MPTSSTVAVSTVTLAMAWEQIRKQQLMSSTEGKENTHKQKHLLLTHQLMSLKVVVVMLARLRKRKLEAH